MTPRIIIFLTYGLIGNLGSGLRGDHDHDHDHDRGAHGHPQRPVFISEEVSTAAALEFSRQRRAGAVASTEKKWKQPSLSTEAVLIVNQAKSGTGFLVGEVHSALGCRDIHLSLPMVLTYICKGGVLVVRSHSPEHAVAALNALVPNRGGGKCQVLTGVRDPLLAIPSKFFEGSKAELCDGEQPKEEVIAKYAEYLKRRGAAHGIFETTWTMLRAFGATSVTEEMTKLWANGGHSVLSSPSSDWAGCELLALEMTHSSMWDAAIGEFVPGAEALKSKAAAKGLSRKDMCPNAVENYQAVVDYVLPEPWLKNLDEANKVAGEAVRFYASTRTSSSSSSAPIAAAAVA